MQKATFVVIDIIYKNEKYMKFEQWLFKKRRDVLQKEKPLLTGTTCCKKNVLPTSLTSNDQQNAWWTGPGCGDQ